MVVKRKRRRMSKRSAERVGVVDTHPVVIGGLEALRE
jgi:hypothetical protein